MFRADARQHNESVRSLGITSLGEEVPAGLATLGAARINVVVSRDNEPANALYARLAFSCRGEIAVHARAQSNVWVM